jgi:hypothetical protein
LIAPGTLSNLERKNEAPKGKVIFRGKNTGYTKESIREWLEVESEVSVGDSIHIPDDDTCDVQSDKGINWLEKRQNIFIRKRIEDYDFYRISRRGNLAVIDIDDFYDWLNAVYDRATLSNGILNYICQEVLVDVQNGDVVWFGRGAEFAEHLNHNADCLITDLGRDFYFTESFYNSFAWAEVAVTPEQNFKKEYREDRLACCFEEALAGAVVVDCMLESSQKAQLLESGLKGRLYKLWVGCYWFLCLVLDEDVYICGVYDSEPYGAVTHFSGVNFPLSEKVGPMSFPFDLRLSEVGELLGKSVRGVKRLIRNDDLGCSDGVSLDRATVPLLDVQRLAENIMDEDEFKGFTVRVASWVNRMRQSMISSKGRFTPTAPSTFPAPLGPRLRKIYEDEIDHWEYEYKKLMDKEHIKSSNKRAISTMKACVEVFANYVADYTSNGNTNKLRKTDLKRAVKTKMDESGEDHEQNYVEKYFDILFKALPDEFKRKAGERLLTKSNADK